MSDLARFAARVQEQMARASRQPHWSAEAAERYMDELRLRLERFTELARRLVADVIQPRLVAVAAHFPNASRAKDEPADCCSYWFGYSERFPASTKVVFRVEHDLRVERVAVCYEAEMMPVFHKLNERDKLVLAIDAVTADEVATWVEERLLDFLDAYLQIDRGEADASDDLVTDPVCGMRLARSEVRTQTDYRGHTYFFCSDQCQAKFMGKPTDFISFRTL